VAVVTHEPAKSLLDTRSLSVNGILFEERGAHMDLFVDGHNIGIVTARERCKVRADHSAFRQVVATAGESEEWFAHTAGFLYCRGSRKAPATTPSKVKVYDLASKAAMLVS